jgi:hypothetical protein
MPSSTHRFVRPELCVCCHSAYVPAKSSLCSRCESELYPNAAPPARTEQRTGTDRRKHDVPVAVNLREIDRRGFLDAVDDNERIS